MVKTKHKSAKNLKKTGIQRLFKPQVFVVLAFLVVFLGVLSRYSSVGAYNVNNIISPIAPGYSLGVLTHDHGDKFSLTSKNGTTIAAADSTNTGGNSRFFFWQTGSPVLTDSESCATWNISSLLDQQGVALRITNVNGVTRGVTVTKNVYYSAFWIFNVHVWDSSNLANPYTQIGEFPLNSTFVPNGQYAPLPWNLCAKVVGNTLSFIAWPAIDSQPAWGDPNFGGSVSLPSGYENGYAGWYFGHIAAGKTIKYTSLSAGLVSP
jgi:hypothetical protein